MTDFIWPLDLIPQLQTWRIFDPAARFTSPLSGSIRSASRPGKRMGTTMTFPAMRGSDRARAKAIVAGLGQSDRIWVPDFSTTSAGAMSCPELFSNNDFSNGTDGWTGTRATLAVTDRVMRVTNSKSAGAMNFTLGQSVTTFVANAPYCIRGFAASQSRSSISKAVYDAVSVISTAATGPGMMSVMFVPNTASWGTVNPLVADYLTGRETIAGDFVDVSFASVARCGLVDNSSNRLLYSDQFDNAAWTKTNSTVTANDTAAPDGYVTADALVENTTLGDHSVSQGATVSASAHDLSATFCIKAGTRSWAALTISDNIAHGYNVFVNLTTGAIGSYVQAGTNVTNPRAVAKDLGNGWFRVSLVVNKGGSQATMYAYASAATGDGGISYSGTAAAKALYLWRGGFAASSVAFIPAQTTSAASSGTSQTGSALNVKGLAVSTSGLRRIGDPVQVGNQINFLSAAMDTDAAGCAVMQTVLPWRVSPADNDPVIFNTPMALMRLASDDTNWDTGPGQFSPFQFDLVEDVA